MRRGASRRHAVSELVRRHMKPLEKYLRMKDITDICINNDGEVWVYREKGGWIAYQDPAINTRELLMLFENVATLRNQKFSDLYPVLSTALPFYGYRVEVQHPNILAGVSIGVSIRTSKIKDYPPEAFFLTGKDDKRPRPPAKLKTDQVYENVKAMLERDEHAQAVRYLMANEKSVIIAGGTSTAKTTCLNSLLGCISMNSRVLTIEDTQEIRVKQKNWLGILKSKSGTDIAQANYKTIVNSCLRSRPDTILFGELDVDNTLPFLRLGNTGHRGGLATVHANSADKILEAIMTNLEMAKYTLRESAVDRLLRSGVYAIAHMEAWQGPDGKTNRMGTLELLR